MNDTLNALFSPLADQVNEAAGQFCSAYYHHITPIAVAMSALILSALACTVAYGLGVSAGRN